MTADPHTPNSGPRNALSGPESASTPPVGASRRSEGLCGPQAGADGFGSGEAGALDPETAQQLLAALQGGASAIVCYSRCWACQFDEHRDPPTPHPWANDEDRDHAKATGQPEPTGNCACHCARPAP